MSEVPTDQSTCIEVLPSVDELEVIEKKSRNAEGREDIDDGFFVCNLGTILSKYKGWVKTFPDIVPFYAVKCNDDSIMLKTLIALGTGFDCASKGEIQKVLELGGQPEKIIYANPLKQASHIRYARDNGVKLVVVDSEEELTKMKANYPKSELVLRIQANGIQGIRTMSKKFGADMKLSYHLIDVAHEMGLTMIGVCFHAGVLCSNPKIYYQALKHARDLFDYADTVGYKFNLLDIGGGFAGKEEDKLKFEEIAPVVNQYVNTLFPADKFKHVRVIAEPGRYFAESVFTLATNVIAKKKVTRSVLIRDTEDNDEKSQNNLPLSEETAFKYIITDGLHGSFNFVLHAGFKGPLPILLKVAPKEAPTFLSSVFGPTLNPDDLVVKRHKLPELNVSDWIIWRNMGAYTITLSSFFNGILHPSVYYVISKDQLAIFRDLTQGKDSLGLVRRESGV